MKKLALRSLKVIFIGLLVSIAPVFILLLFEAAPVTYSAREILTPKVAPGQEFCARIEAKIKKDCLAKVSRSIFDGRGVGYSVNPVERPELEKYNICVPVPLGAFPGKSSYRARIEWQCNLVQQWFPNIVDQEAIIFEIVPADGQNQLPGQQGVYQKPFTKSEYARIVPQ